MKTTPFTSREFNQDTGRAKKAGRKGPVFITDRGQPSFVLFSFEDCQRLSPKRRSLGELLAMPGIEDIDFEISRL